MNLNLKVKLDFGKFDLKNSYTQKRAKSFRKISWTEMSSTVNFKIQLN